LKEVQSLTSKTQLECNPTKPIKPKQNTASELKAQRSTVGPLQIKKLTDTLRARERERERER
jgi:hypothetical protein